VRERAGGSDGDGRKGVEARGEVDKKKCGRDGDEESGLRGRKFRVQVGEYM